MCTYGTHAGDTEIHPCESDRGPPPNLSNCHILLPLPTLPRSGGTSLGLVARHTHVFQELGITRGQYTGLLPLLVRHGVANLFTMPDRHNAVATAAAARHSGAGEAKGVGGGRVRRQRVAGPAADGGWAEVRYYVLVVVFDVGVRVLDFMSVYHNPGLTVFCDGSWHES